ncbi:Activating molecule in BECN1-regulated autophagy protein [Actinidia chinensis var. chinensis]|uniref:Activating molecule in BECN1-regulated autophagy protein n=1 Tax=Actinidia chinensis var. chinensis TaxID=1590841 RepID=A0A2R6PX51_ACTCC|nr:Activating molecule in BECN1-regulated autophagy protein [Actinidia chinensis var. chinensis]
MRSSYWANDANAPSTSSSQPRRPQAAPGNQNSKHSGSNVVLLLARREVAPRTKHSSKKLWGEASNCHLDSFGLKQEAARDARQGLVSWVEAKSLRHLSAMYCPLLPPPRSTIAAAFSPDGKALASTHGDHTVKVIDFQTGRCLKVMSGHRRTPWVVRFHPLYPDILASGSLDHEVRLWDANTAECIGSRDFYRPIASIAFHAQGELLAVASGHKLYIWHYNRRGDTSSPTIVLKTRRSLRAVHFHPHAAPFLLTAEVNDLDSSDSSMTLATSPGYLCYPPPTVFLADAHSAHRVGPAAAVQLLTYPTPSGQYELLLSPIESSTSPVPEERQSISSLREMENVGPPPTVDAMETAEVQPEERSNQYFSFGDPRYWELPFLQGWLIGQSQASQRMIHPLNGGASENPSAFSEIENPSVMVPSVVPSIIGQSRVSGRSDSRHRSSRSRMMSLTGSGEGAASNNTAHDGNDTQPFVSRIQTEIATSLAAVAAAELPCTVKLRVWNHDLKDPCAPLDAERCRLAIPHAVLCSEMGAHFSPCGRFLAACVACVLPHLEGDPGLHSQAHHDVMGVSTSPTRHPISAHQVIYELRIYSLEEATFGFVLASRPIRAAHCLTSIQFSPTSEHLLLAYGRRHSSLLKSVVIDGETTIPIYTILEIYRVSDMELVTVLPSAEDEVNVACFHPSVGSGLVYGTKEGKLRILQHEGSHSVNCTTSTILDENMLEVPTYALEC